MSDFYKSLTGGSITREDLEDKGVIQPASKVTMLQPVQDSPGGGSYGQAIDDPRQKDKQQVANNVEQKMKEAAREAMKDPSKDINEVNNGLQGEITQARKGALQWLSEGNNFWIVAAIILFLLWRK